MDVGSDRGFGARSCCDGGPLHGRKKPNSFATDSVSKKAGVYKILRQGRPHYIGARVLTRSPGGTAVFHFMEITRCEMMILYDDALRSTTCARTRLHHVLRCMEADPPEYR